MRLNESETILHQLGPQPSILAIWFFTKCLPPALVGAVACGFFTVLLWAATNSRRPELAGVAVGVLVGLLSLLTAYVYCSFLRKTYVYYITDQRCVFHGGILRRVERSVPYHKVTDVQITQHIVERILGISKLQIFTPGTASTPSPFGGQLAEISFVGLEDSETPAATVNGILRKFRATGE